MPFDGTVPVEPDNVLQVLIKARGHIERGWCKNALARTSNGRKIDPYHADAAKWCAIGAVIATTGTDSNPAVYRRLTAAAKWLGSPNVMAFNDAQWRRERVLMLYDVAISMQRERGAVKARSRIPALILA